MTDAPDLDALWSEWGIRSYGKAGRQIARELQGLVRDTVHQERVRMDLSAEAAVVAARRGREIPKASHAATVLQDGEGVAGKDRKGFPCE